VAQTKRKRKTKHRGNAAGYVETRGRTGRPPSPAEKKKATRDEARIARLNRAPTWKSSSFRAGLATLFMFAFLYLTNKHKLAAALVFAAVAFMLYCPASYYMERALWKRRMKKQGLSIQARR
jgi:hypothetical protein